MDLKFEENQGKQDAYTYKTVIFIAQSKIVTAMHTIILTREICLIFLNLGNTNL